MRLLNTIQVAAYLMLVPVLLLFPAVQAHAETAQMGTEKKPYIYTIKKGDTLWGISERFITDPWYWPNLWANNPFIRNPHLIYPGQQVAIYDGRIELLPRYAEGQSASASDVAQGEEPMGEEASAVVMPEPVEEISISVKTDLHSFISAADLEQCGIIVDTVDDRIMMTKNDTVFVQMDDNLAEIGQEYDLYKIGDMVIHPHTGAKLGHKTTWLGTVQLTGAHTQVYSGEITAARQEIERGSILLPAVKPQQEIVLKRAAQILNGTIVVGQQKQLSLAQGDVFYVDMGTNSGLEVGNMLTVVRPRSGSELALQGENVELPDTLLGRALVVTTGPATAAALMLKAAEPVVRGDLVFTEVE